MRTSSYKIEGPWRGKLAIAARPRGGDWLEEEIGGWSEAGVDVIASLLESHEEVELELGGERGAAGRRGLKFLSFPIADRGVPASDAAAAEFVRQLESDLDRGANVLIHCRQGIGRAGLIAVCLLVAAGADLQTAVDQVGRARGVAVPETLQQFEWLHHFADVFAGAR